MEHPSENTLGLYAIDPRSLASRLSVEEHLDACSACRAVLDEIRAFDTALAEPETWFVASDAVVDVEPIAELRRFEATMVDDDSTAAELLREFEMPDAAAHFVWFNVADKAKFRTGGVARRLCQLANGMCEKMPRYALALAEAAISIASALSDESYPRGTIHELRGDTWKEQANALHYLGRFTEALAALAHAESEYRRLRVPGLGLVAVQYLRAGALFEQERFELAETLARESATAALELV